MRTSVFLLLSAILSLVVGCGDAPQTGGVTAQNNAVSPATTAPSTSTEMVDASQGFTPLAPKKRYDDPREAVNDFLVAITTGDNSTATSLMSYEAQRETWSNGLALSSDGFPGSHFQITDLEVIKPSEETHVETTWVDENQNSYPCVWLLKNGQNGWCIYAMATRYMENAPPVILNFEDHDKLKQEQEKAMRTMQQVAARQQAQRIGTQQPSAAQGQIQQTSGQQFAR